MRITRAVVPSLFTVLNVFCGFMAIIHVAHDEVFLASWFIILAALFDTLDGVMARITKSSSNFGIEFDSLSDVVSFGVAPSFLVYTISLQSMGGFGTLISAMPMVFGALRLARFNAQIVGYDKDYFKGLPIPSSAIMLASFTLTFYDESTGLQHIGVLLLPPLVVVLSLLMVSTIKYDAVPKFSRRGIKQHPLRFTIGIIGITAILLTRGHALFPFFVFYTATGPLRYSIQFSKHLLHPDDKTVEEKDAEITSVDI